MDLDGELDFASADAAVCYVKDVIDRHPGPVIVDLAALVFCDARGLAALVRMAAYAEQKSCPFRLASPSPSLVKIMRITGLDRGFLIHLIVRTGQEGPRAPLPAYDRETSSSTFTLCLPRCSITNRGHCSLDRQLTIRHGGDWLEIPIPVFRHSRAAIPSCRRRAAFAAVSRWPRELAAAGVGAGRAGRMPRRPPETRTVRGSAGDEVGCPGNPGRDYRRSRSR